MGVTTGTLIALFFDGLANGFLFAVLGVGITLIFGLGEILNLTHGTFAVMGVLAAFAVNNATANLPLSIVLGIGTVGLVGVVIDRSVFRPIYAVYGDRRVLMGVFVTLGLAITIEGLMAIYYPAPFSLPFEFGGIRTLGTTVTGGSIVITVVSTVVLTLLFLFLRRTYVGMAMRTIIQDETGAVLCGIDTRRMRTIVFVLSAMLAGLAGLLVSIRGTIAVGMAFELTVFGLFVSIVGGVKSVRGAVVAGLILGYTVTVSNYVIGTYFANLILFGVAVTILLLRPETI